MAPYDDVALKPILPQKNAGRYQLIVVLSVIKSDRLPVYPLQSPEVMSNDPFIVELVHMALIEAVPVPVIVT